MTQTWLITGSSRGIGRSLARAALAAGHQVVATARRPEQLADLVAGHGDNVLPVALDVTDPAAARAAVEQAVARFGHLDVVVNNAGYANLSPIEHTDDADFRAQFETNVWGVYNVSRAALPALRAAGGGTFVQISSIGGRVGGSPGIASYQAAKFAVDGFSRVLAAEAAPFGIRVLVVEPSGFRTDWAGSSMTVQDIPADYEQTVGFLHSRTRGAAEGAAGDPDRAAEIITRVVALENLPSHLPLGAGAVEMALADSRRETDEVTAWAQVSRSADFGQPYPAVLPVAVG